MSLISTSTAVTIQPTRSRLNPSVNRNSNQIWMSQADAIESCPPGLEYLSSVDHLLVKQNVELFEALTGFEAANKYLIVNSMGQRIYFAVEDSEWCTRACCGPGRPFEIRILDNYGTEVIHLNRPLSLPCYCFPFGRQSMEVSAPPGAVVGSVVQEGSFCDAATFKILDYEGNIKYTIKGPCCQCNCFQESEYQLLCKNGINEFGTIKKHWTGLLKEALTDADNFGITFPIDIDVTMKATLLGALFLIDFMFYEKGNN